MDYAKLVRLEDEIRGRFHGRNGSRFLRQLGDFLKGQQPDPKGVPGFDDLDRWVEFYEALGVSIGPRVSDEQKAALTEYGFRPIFFPAIGEDCYPSDFVKLDWEKFLKGTKIKHLPLPGRLGAIETIAKSNWNDPAGYPNDRLAKAIGLDRRFGNSWDDLHKEGGVFEKVAAKLGFPTAQVRCPSARQWNFAANIFNKLRIEHKEPLPNLGDTNSWEWCEDACGSGDRLIAGHSDGGGLSAVDDGWQSDCYDSIGFRVLVQF